MAAAGNKLFDAIVVELVANRYLFHILSHSAVVPQSPIMRLYLGKTGSFALIIHLRSLAESSALVDLDVISHEPIQGALDHWQATEEALHTLPVPYPHRPVRT